MYKIGNLGLCEYKNCTNESRGRCEGSISYTYNGKVHFSDDCNKYFCDKHLKWGRGSHCVAAKFCPNHHRGYYCIIL